MALAKDFKVGDTVKLTGERLAFFQFMEAISGGKGFDGEGVVTAAAPKLEDIAHYEEFDLEDATDEDAKRMIVYYDKAAKRHFVIMDEEGDDEEVTRIAG